MPDYVRAELTVIRVGRTHYRVLIDAMVAAGPKASPSTLLEISPGPPLAAERPDKGVA